LPSEAQRVAQLYSFSQTLPGEISDPPIITDIHIESDAVVISWEGAATLEQAAAVEGPYAPVNGVASPHRETLTLGQRFFRLSH
jgi:hypothetical protein